MQSLRNSFNHKFLNQNKPKKTLAFSFTTKTIQDVNKPNMRNQNKPDPTQTSPPYTGESLTETFSPVIVC